MYPTFSDLLHDLFGWDILLPIQTFGLFVAISFLTASFILRKELRRKELAGLLSPRKEMVRIGNSFSFISIAVNFAAGSTIGLLLMALADICFNKTNWVNTFKSLGMLLYFVLKQHWILLVVSGLAFLVIRYIIQTRNNPEKPIIQEKQIWPHEHVDAILGIAAIGGLIGAKFFDALENWSSYMAHPESFIAFSGLTFYGGLIVAALGIFIYATKKGIGRWHLADSAAPALMIGYGIGRIGCHMAGDGDWGIENPYPKPFHGLPDWLWSYTYPHNVSDQGIPIPGCGGPHCFELSHGVYPTSLYEFAACTLLFAILWLIRKRLKAAGMLFGVYLCLNGAERFLVELIRVNNRYQWGFFRPTQAELISVALLLTGTVLITLRSKLRQSTRETELKLVYKKQHKTDP
ncbi:prolipoprotein diacylglyceryl transferase [Mucilaginibacter rubeus]|uniref:Phosphatidylglycerol--prolipoprotein diacylglyceryl transferase n=1 Tax=Mucilaginibacter rubeus TaxID=2027860 RepID=A0AAE6JKX4_9SPHI|nr:MULTISPECIES: prolipoprotein diacylglyceryl transferase family protein [Mucilaginibacter]QEM06452.1 prolipoprotein diacylglyceryl transferase [Mucilaginibacter rubeus]QEM19038.1 prolipoprotein diacylglyceryl transferase [Mucilaginibacter gossypii]QTE44421.1 prolipoprotein diacylglyceryl transferase [Mucilaginibacter rubeus]QTE51020.1 prolipoprotein diacylglyceryl transferase [Mucilaginibacter rubeus]QTE56103.1 prolipoprotein diacylglyceryl transferase [Mucilaginibacter rubeus]